jgi:DNA polymerase (family X)
MAEHLLRFPGLMEVIGQGENKISFRQRNGIQVDVRLLPPESFGAAMQYFTGSKAHNVALRQRALKMGYTLNEYSLADPRNRKARRRQKRRGNLRQAQARFHPSRTARKSRRNRSRRQTLLAASCIELADIRGDVHMHTVETDGRNTIEEMAEAARGRGYQYMAITDHSKNLAFANGLTDERALAHIETNQSRRQKVFSEKGQKPIRIFAGIEVDILADGSLDLSDSVLEQMDIVIASVHSHFNQDRDTMTERLLRAVANPNTSLIGHPTGRLLLRRDAYAFDLDAVLKAAARHKVAMELNAYPDRLDLSDVHLRMARQHGVKDRHQHRLSPHLPSRKDPLRRYPGAACVAHQREMS